MASKLYLRKRMVDGPTLEFDDCLFIFAPGSAKLSESDLKFAQDILQQSARNSMCPWLRRLPA